MAATKKKDKVVEKEGNSKNKIPGKGGKRIKAIRAQINKENLYPALTALEAVKANANAKFDESLEVSINLGVDAKQSDQMVRGVVSLPNGTGKEVKVAVFARGDKAEDAKKAGADIVGAEDLVEKIKNGELNFDKCIATPDMMAMIGAIAKILGPRGLMPNPKLGTVTVNVGDAVKAAKSGQVEFKIDKAGILHAAFGKASFTVQQLQENFRALLEAVVKAKPAGSKGTYLRSVFVSSTMGGAYKLDVGTIFN